MGLCELRSDCNILAVCVSYGLTVIYWLFV